MKKHIINLSTNTAEDVDLTQVEIDTENAKSAAWIAGADDRKAIEERVWRDKELVSTDQYALSDRTMSSEMSTYRQELRDMPDLADFPNTHTRPSL